MSICEPIIASNGATLPLVLYNALAWPRGMVVFVFVVLRAAARAFSVARVFETRVASFVRIPVNAKSVSVTAPDGKNIFSKPCCFADSMTSNKLAAVDVIDNRV